MDAAGGFKRVRQVDESPRSEPDLTQEFAQNGSCGLS